MRLSIRSWLLVALLPACAAWAGSPAVPVSAAGGVNAIHCPATVAPGQDVQTKTPTAVASGLYEVNINHGNDLITTGKVALGENVPTPLSVTQDQAYLASYKRLANNDVELIPGTYTSGVSMLFNVNDPQATETKLDYRINFVTYSSPKLIGPKSAQIQLPVENEPAEACGTVALGKGQSQTFPLGKQGLTATVKRLQ